MSRRRGDLIVKFVAFATTEEVSRLKSLCDEFEVYANSGEVAGAGAAMVEFYTYIAYVARADVLKDVLDQLMARTSFLRATSMSSKGRMAESVQEICAIVKAVKAGDAQAAREAVVTHVQSAARTSLARLKD